MPAKESARARKRVSMYSSTFFATPVEISSSPPNKEDSRVPHFVGSPGFGRRKEEAKIVRSAGKGELVLPFMQLIEQV